MARAKKPDDAPKATVSVNGGPAVDLDVLEEAARKARKQGAAAAKKAIKMLEALRELGPPLTWPTRFKPHLVAKKKKAKETLSAAHGVTFKRADADCLVEATNGIAFVRIRLGHEGAQAPTIGIVPAKAMKLISQAEDELASIWFHGNKVAIVVDDEIHEFRCIPPDLPFPTQDLDPKGAPRTVSNVHLDADHLFRVQQALDASSLAFRSLKGMVALVPDGVEGENFGCLALWGDA